MLSDVKTIRTALGLSQSQFAERLGVQYQQVQRWEKNGPGHSFWLRMALVSVDNLASKSDGDAAKMIRKIVADTLHGGER